MHADTPISVVERVARGAKGRKSRERERESQAPIIHRFTVKQPEKGCPACLGPFNYHQISRFHLCSAGPRTANPASPLGEKNSKVIHDTYTRVNDI